MTKNKAVALINNFGKREEHSLIWYGQYHDAHQIRTARNAMVYAITESIKNVRELLCLMTEYTVDADGNWHYDPIHFVHHEYTRQLVEDFKKKFNA